MYAAPEERQLTTVDHPDAIQVSQAVAIAILLARSGRAKANIVSLGALSKSGYSWLVSLWGLA
jgi:hypothetical protein